MRNSIITKCTTYSREGSWKWKKKSVVQWVASRKIRWPASTYTSIVGRFFRYCFTSICMCVTFSICFLGFGHALFEWVVWETKPKKDGDFGQMNYDDSSIWIETIGLEKLRPLFISQWIHSDWKEIFIRIATNNSLQIK